MSPTSNASSTRRSVFESSQLSARASRMEPKARVIAPNQRHASAVASFIGVPRTSPRHTSGATIMSGPQTKFTAASSQNIALTGCIFVEPDDRSILSLEMTPIVGHAVNNNNNTTASKCIHIHIHIHISGPLLARRFCPIWFLVRPACCVRHVSRRILMLMSFLICSHNTGITNIGALHVSPGNVRASARLGHTICGLERLARLSAGSCVPRRG